MVDGLGLSTARGSAFRVWVLGFVVWGPGSRVKGLSIVTKYCSIVRQVLSLVAKYSQSGSGR